MPRIIKLAKGTYTSSTITVDGDGRVITAADGEGGGAAVATTTTYNSTGTHTSSANSVWMQVALSGGGGSASLNNQAQYLGNPGGTTNFGTHASAPGGNRGQPVSQGTGGSNSNNLYWAVGSSQPGGATGGGTVGGGNQGGALFGSGTGGTRTSTPSTSGGSGGVTGAVLLVAAYGASTGIPIAIGAGGSGPPQSTDGSDGRAVVVEYST